MASILVVDDDDLVRETVRQMLESAGHQVIEARNGHEALSAANKNSVALVVTDIIMPDMEGIATIRELRAQNPELKIIAMSGGDRRARVDYLDLAKKLGAHHTLPKPFRRDDMLSAVRSALS
jgi:CheY-like chemotaxis protein